MRVTDGKACCGRADAGCASTAHADAPEAPTAPVGLVVLAVGEHHVPVARDLADRLGVACVMRDDGANFVHAGPARGDASSFGAGRAGGDVPLLAAKPPTDGLVLRLDDDGLTLAGGGMELRADFTRMLRRLGPANLQRELLVRAARVKGADAAPTAVDATAGLGEDSLLLAAAGFSVTLCECNPVIAALLRDALRRAADVPELRRVVARMRFVEGDSLAVLPCLPEPPDVVYLDPMFPARQKSAAVKKKFQLLHCLERPCANQEELLRAALDARPRKVVVKRPPKGPHLAGVKPDYSLEGKAVRYDCIALARDRGAVR